MGLDVLQRFLVTLYTDSDLTARFAVDPIGVAAESGLDSFEAERLARLAMPQIQRFGDALLSKRRQEVKKILPMTWHALGDESFGSLFDSYAKRSSVCGTKRHYVDALAFSQFILEQPSHPKLTRPWFVDLVRFEHALCRTRFQERWITVFCSRYPIMGLASDLRRGESWSTHPSFRPTLVVWFRCGPLGRLRTVRLGGHP